MITRREWPGISGRFVHLGLHIVHLSYISEQSTTLCAYAVVQVKVQVRAEHISRLDARVIGKISIS
jgi:hypothetical protein